ncbi:S1 RNA-binding domain-containing protein, partial [bacterium]|nr:S1 RNA-binding domain-containing protein [bacterium]MBU1025863.1 S1 RNA-binding domain-containing protein [bacterium]
MSNEFIGEGTPLGDIPEIIPNAEPPKCSGAFPDDFGEMRTYHKGEITTGKVIEVREDVVLIDIKTKSEGVLPKEEVSFAPNPTTSDIQVGEEIEVMVVKEGEDVYTLSKRRVDEKRIWDRVADAHAQNCRMTGKIIAAVNGGLIIDIGGRAFLPQSQIDLKRIDDLDSLIGQDIEVKVLEHDQEKNRLVVSRRLCIEEDLDKEKFEAFDNVKRGAVMEGTVDKIVDYGVFINLGNGVTGLLHVSELSWERVENPRDILKIGDVIQVKVLKIDRDKKKISLSRKSTLPEPWDTVKDKYRNGTITEGIVTRVASFGCFIKLDDYFEGLAHISELVDQRINHAKEVFTPGDKVTVIILDVDKKRKRIRLSVKKALEKQTEREVNSFLKQQGELDNTLGSRFGSALGALYLGDESDLEEKPVKSVKSSRENGAAKLSKRDALLKEIADAKTDVAEAEELTVETPDSESDSTSETEEVSASDETKEEI